MRKLCKVYLQNEVVTVVKYDDIYVQMPTYPEFIGKAWVEVVKEKNGLYQPFRWPEKTKDKDEK